MTSDCDPTTTTLTTFTGTSKVKGTLNFYVCGHLVQVSVRKVKPANALAAVVAAKINATATAVTATSKSGVLTLTARQESAQPNDLPLVKASLSA